MLLCPPVSHPDGSGHLLRSGLGLCGSMGLPLADLHIKKLHQQQQQVNGGCIYMPAGSCEAVSWQSLLQVNM